jgi:uncharacterized membrane protein YczE
VGDTGRKRARTRVVRRLPRLVVGLVLFGAGIAFLIQAGFGVPPWDVLHVGLADRLGVSVGTVVVVVGVLLLVVQALLREPIGVGTVANVIVIGPSIDAVLNVLPDTEMFVPRLALMITGPVLVGIGSGFYLGVHLGPGPRDSLMTAFARRRGRTLRFARFVVEAATLVVGWLLGGPVGVGTVWFALSIGPLVHASYDRLAIVEVADS